jgi:hypothetical protein
MGDSARRLTRGWRRRANPYAWLQGHGRSLHRWWPGRLADPIFVIGAPRSGTTILGQILSQAPGLHYIYEARYIWTALDPALDAWGYQYPIEQVRLCGWRWSVSPAGGGCWSKSCRRIAFASAG